MSTNSKLKPYRIKFKSGKGCVALDPSGGNMGDAINSFALIFGADNIESVQPLHKSQERSQQ